MSSARCSRTFVLALGLAAALAAVAAPLLAHPTYIVELTGEPAAVTAARAAAVGTPLPAETIQQLRDDVTEQQEILLSRLRRDGVGFVIDIARVPSFPAGT